jgi:hypothetical protein
LQAITNNNDPLISAEDGRKTVELFTAIYRSQQSKEIVTFPIE